MSVAKIVLISRVVVTSVLVAAIAVTWIGITIHNADLAVAGGAGVSLLKVATWGAWTVTR